MSVQFSSDRLQSTFQVRAITEAPQSINTEQAVLKELNRIAEGTDLRQLLPRLSTAALQFIQAEQQESLFPLIEVLLAIEGGQLRAESFHSVLPNILAVTSQVPQEVAATLLERFRQEAFKVAAELREESRSHQQPVECVEVHVDVVSNACDLGPIMGTRYKAPVCTLEEPPEAPADLLGEDVELLSSNACKAVISQLLQHSDEVVRRAARIALRTNADPKEVTRDKVSYRQFFIEPDHETEVAPEDDVDRNDEDQEWIIEGEQTYLQDIEEDEEEGLLAATILSSEILMLGVEAQEDPSARGDVTEEFASIVANSGISQVYCAARVELPVSAIGTEVPLCIRAVVINSGQVPWPETAAICLVSGESFSFPQMALGALKAGEAAEIIMDLLLPLRLSPAIERSMWAVVDTSTSVEIGPLLMVEAVHAAEQVD